MAAVRAMVAAAAAAVWPLLGLAPNQRRRAAAPEHVHVRCNDRFLASAFAVGALHAGPPCTFSCTRARQVGLAPTSKSIRTIWYIVNVSERATNYSWT
eukprot:2099963-Prymnesium_polylepis.1